MAEGSHVRGEASRDRSHPLRLATVLEPEGAPILFSIFSYQLASSNAWRLWPEQHGRRPVLVVEVWSAAGQDVGARHLGEPVALLLPLNRTSESLHSFRGSTSRVWTSARVPWPPSPPGGSVTEANFDQSFQNFEIAKPVEEKGEPSEAPSSFPKACGVGVRLGGLRSPNQRSAAGSVPAPDMKRSRHCYRDQLHPL